MSESSRHTGHVFLCYARQDSARVDNLQKILEDAGIPIWRDTSSLWPGEDWRLRIRSAIMDDALVFVACYSQASMGRLEGYQNAELAVAREQLLQRPPGAQWFIPVRFDDVKIPDDLAAYQCADLFDNKAGENTERLVVAIRNILGATDKAAHARSAERPASVSADEMQPVRDAGLGTAYIIDEASASWQHEEKASALAYIRKKYASMLTVPGPGALGERWQWQADADAARRWDERADQLVSSFWAVHYNDDHMTSNAVFIWAPWPVAMAFGARATARRRGLILNVCRRASYGAAGPSPELHLTDDSHDFLSHKQPVPLEESAPQHSATCLPGRLALTIEPLTSINASQPASRRTTARSRSVPQHDPAPPLVLLVRTIHDFIGEIPLDLSTSPPVAVTVHASPDLVGSVLPTGTHEVEVAEWRLDSAIRPVPHLPWEAFPAAVNAIADWIIAQVSGDRERVVLLVTRIPQELPVGLGIQLGLRTSQWPKHMYPLYYAGGRLVVPNLRLGATSVPAERA